MQQEQDIKIYIPQTHGTAHPQTEPAPETDERVAIWKPSAHSGTYHRETPH